MLLWADIIVILGVAVASFAFGFLCRCNNCRTKKPQSRMADEPPPRIIPRADDEAPTCFWDLQMAYMYSLQFHADKDDHKAHLYRDCPHTRDKDAGIVAEFMLCKDCHKSWAKQADTVRPRPLRPRRGIG